MTDTFDSRNRTPETGGDPSSRSGSMATTGPDEPTTADELQPQHDQPAEGGVEEAEDGDGDGDAPARR
ncbi:MAG TPA: hypothetical protein VFL03_03970 [Candidatus Limnocylindrales bacterium]|nr:hypothetical protein [Candidatus Limnocylindrales bacterium]